MKKLIPILLLSIISCNQKDIIDKDRITLSIKNYYAQHPKDIKSIDDVTIDSIVPMTEKKQLEDDISASEKKYYYFVEAKDDEYADSTAKKIEKMQLKLKTAEDKTLLYYAVYHTIKFTGPDLRKRKRQSNLNMEKDYTIRPNSVTESDKIEGIKGEELYKPYSE